MTPSKTVHEAILTALQETLSTVLLRAEELLFTLAAQSGDARSVDLHLDTLRYLRDLRGKGMGTILHGLQEPQTPSATAGAARVLQALERLALHVEAVHFETLAAIERELVPFGADGDRLIRSLRPQSLSAALAIHLMEQPASPAIQLLLIRLLEQLLVPALGETYRDSLALLKLHRPAGSQGVHGEDIDHTASGVMQRDALLAHLDAIQARPCDPASPPDPDLSVLRGIPDLPPGATLAPDIQRLMDLMGLMVYDAVTDPSIPPGFKASLLRMRLPLLKAALLDREVLHDTRHPVRQLWSRLIELARAPGAEQAPWRSRVEHVIAQLCKDFARDLGIFTRALDKLRSTEYLPRDIAPAMARGSTAQPSPSLSFNAARHAATQAIHTTLAAHGTIPPAVRTFLLQTWGPLLLMVAQRAGPQGEPWDQAVGMMQELIGLTDAGGKNLRERREPLLARMQDTLRHYGLEQRGFLKALESLRQALDDHAATQALPAAPPAPLAPSFPTPQPAPPALPPRAVEEFLRAAVQPGDWYLVHLAEGQAPRRLKAYHVDRELDMVVFADRMGRPVLDRPIALFIADVLAGRSRAVFAEERHDYALRHLRQALSSSSPGMEHREP